MRKTHTGDRLVEWLFAAMMVVWGFTLLDSRSDTFSLPQYELLKTLANEVVWAIWSICIGGMRIVALWVNGNYFRTPAIRAIGAGLGVVWWLILYFLFLNAPVSNQAAGVNWYPLFVLFEIVCVYKSSIDAYHARSYRGKAKRGDV